MRHRPSTSEMNISIGTTTFMVSEKILKSGIAQLTGATDISGNCLVTFPGSAVSQLDATNAEDLASLLRFYYSLLKCADKVRGMSVLANLQQASTPGISVWLKALEILQKERPGVIAIIYVIKPKNKDKSRQLKKQLGLKVKKSTLGDSLFKVAWLKNIQEVYNHIDPSQLTEDYGGFLSYNHQAWFHFQMDIGSLLRNARELEARVPSSKDQILLLQEYDVADLSLKELDNLLQQLEGKYHEIMQNLNLEETIDKCRYAINNLEQPENDLVLAQISSVVLFTTKVDLNHLYNYFVTTKKELAQIWQEVNFIIQKFRQFHICKEKANQLCLEIAEQYNLRIEQHPIVGKTLNEAQMCSLHFESSLYKPAKELLTRATEILEEMQEIQLPKLPSDDESDPGFLAEFTSTIQLFAETLDNIYKQYTNIHLFYLVFEKCLVWYQKVLQFLPLSLNKLLISVQEPPSTASSSSSTSSSGSVDRPQQNKIEPIPSDWPKLVGTIHTRYPGPKKEHLAILNSAAPPNIDCDARGHSALLAHRIQLLSAVLQKNLFRRHQLQKAMQWKDSLIEGEDNIVSYYLALNSSFPQVQKQPSEILQFSTEEEEKAEDSDESLPHQRSISPRQYHGENHENPQLVPSQEEVNDPSNVQNNPPEMDKQKSSDNDKEYFVSLSCDSDVQPLSFLQQSEEIKKRNTQPQSNTPTPSQQTNVKYMRSTGTKLRKDRKHGRNQQLKKSKKTSLPSFPQSRHFPSTYNEFEDEEQGLFQAQKEYVLPVNWLQKGKNSNGTIIKEIKKVTSSQLPNDEKVNLVQSLLSMLHLQSPTDTSTDSTYLMSLQETRHHRPRFNSLSSRSASGVVPRTTASLPHKHHHQQHPRTARNKNRKASLMDSKGKLSGISRWNTAEQTSLVSSNPMMCSCIQFNCGHNNNNMLRLHDDYLSHSMHNLGRDEVIYDKLSNTVSLTKEHDSYPNLHHPENLLTNSTCRDYSNPSYIPSQFVHRPHISSCPGHPPSPMAVSPGRSMNYVNEWMNCSGAADGLAEDLNTVSLYSPTWDKSETQEFEDVDEITKDLSFDCQLYEQQQEDIRSSLQRTEKILLEQEQLLYSHMMPEEDPEQLTDEILSHLSTDSAYVGDSEHLCPSVLSSNLVQVSSPSSDYDFVGQNSNSPDLLETAYREMDFYDAANLGDSIQDERQWSSEEETEIEARSLSDLAEELDTNSSDVNGKNSEESGVSLIQLQNYPESSSSSSSKISKAEVRSKTEKHHSKTTPVKLSIFQTNSTSEVQTIQNTTARYNARLYTDLFLQIYNMARKKKKKKKRNKGHTEDGVYL